MRIAFLASHNGSSARAITQACDQEDLKADPAVLISNNPESNALKWARDEKLKTYCLNDKNIQDPDREIANILEDHKIDLVVCSGYMKLIGPETISAMKGKILNIHPALLPKYGGKGMYGARVHRAVRESGETQTGITIHLVDGEYDHGKVLSQKTLPVLPADTAEDIQARVQAHEPDFYIETLQKILAGEILL